MQIAVDLIATIAKEKDEQEAAAKAAAEAAAVAEAAALAEAQNHPDVMSPVRWCCNVFFFVCFLFASWQHECLAPSRKLCECAAL